MSRRDHTRTTLLDDDAVEVVPLRSGAVRLTDPTTSSHGVRHVRNPRGRRESHDVWIRALRQTAGGVVLSKLDQYRIGKRGPGSDRGIPTPIEAHELVGSGIPIREYP